MYQAILGSHLVSPFPAVRDTTGLPQLLSWLPVNDSVLNHTNGLIRFRAFPHFARVPPIIAVSGSLSLRTVYFLLLPSDPAVTSNALAIRISFPLIGAAYPSLGIPGLPASLGKQNGPPVGRTIGKPVSEVFIQLQALKLLLHPSL